METVVKLAIEKMSEEIEKLKKTIIEQQKRISDLERLRSQCSSVEAVTIKNEDDELLNNEQVKRILKIGKNSLIKLVRDRVLVVIRINERTVRFSKRSIMEYIQRKGDVQSN